MWKQTIPRIVIILPIYVSEELSSVETLNQTSGIFCYKSFQKNLVVWKLRIYQFILLYLLHVSEELSSVETKV